MCMKNVNLIALFGDVVCSDNSVLLGDILSKKFYCKMIDDKRFVSQISMSVLIAATQTKDEKAAANLDPDLVFAFNHQYEIRVRLTETISGAFKDLDTFTLDPSQNADSEGLCRKTFNHTRLCVFPNVDLPPKNARERFVIKLLIRRVDPNRVTDDGWVVQSIHPLDLIFEE